jgi:hypothetical protein
VSILGVEPSAVPGATYPVFLRGGAGDSQGESIDPGDERKYELLQSWPHGNELLVYGLGGECGLAPDDQRRRQPVTVERTARFLLFVRVAARNAKIENVTVVVEPQGDKLRTSLEFQ